MDSSLFHRALHSLQNPRFLGHHHHHHHRLKEFNSTEDYPVNQISDAEIRGSLSKLYILHIPGQEGFLAVPWLSEAVKLVRFTCAEISQLLLKISYTDKEKSFLEANLEDTLQLLDVSNGLKEALDDLRHYVMLVRYALHSAGDTKNASLEEFRIKVARLHSGLMKAAEFMQTRVEETTMHNVGRSKLETCSSMLRRMDKPLVDASGKSAVKRQLFKDMYGAKVLAIFVCGVLAIAMSVKPKRPLACLEIAEEPSWLVSLQSLQRDVKSITDDSIQCGKVAILKELDDVLSHVNQLLELSKSLQEQASPSDDDKMTFSRQCEKLSEESDALHKGLHELQQHIDGLFRMIVTIRVGLLDDLGHA